MVKLCIKFHEIILSVSKVVAHNSKSFLTLTLIFDLTIEARIMKRMYDTLSADDVYVCEVGV